ncbi:MAG: hypothetical protein ACTTKQ_07165, partial [Filifactor alocis]|uniref:hypothetical protein n=1 Tax=Filifactor alocis TaxID=143361 RepID=UPI003F9FC9B0
DEYLCPRFKGSKALLCKTAGQCNGNRLSKISLKNSHKGKIKGNQVKKKAKSYEKPSILGI